MNAFALYSSNIIKTHSHTHSLSQSVAKVINVRKKKQNKKRWNMLAQMKQLNSETYKNNIMEFTIAYKSIRNSYEIMLIYTLNTERH